MIFLIRRIIKSKEYSSHKCHKIRQTQAYEQRASVLSAEMGDYMNDKSLECIRFYDIQVNKMVKGRGGVILFTDRGCRLFLECSRNDGFYLRDEAVTKAVSDAGFENVDTYVRNQDGELFTVGDDGHRYVMKNWFGGRECDVKSVNDVMEAVRTLARLHICLNVVSSNGVRYLRNNVNTNITKQWECMALAETADEQPESELKASESIVHNAVHFDRGAGLRTNMERHTKEIKKAANYMRGKKKKNEFEQIALGAVDTFFREADEASRNINSKRFLSLEYISGEHLEQYIEKGLDMLTECADGGDTFACYKLGRIYFKGEIVLQDLDKAEKYLLSAEDNEFTQYAFGKLYLQKEKYDILKAVDCFEKSADKNVWSSYQLGRLYLFGAEGLEKDKEKSMEWLTKSANDGNEYAQNMLNNMAQFENAVIANTIFSLFANLSRCIEDDYTQKYKSVKRTVDSRLRRMIQKKRQALGIKDDQPTSYEQSC